MNGLPAHPPASSGSSGTSRSYVRDVVLVSVAMLLLGIAAGLVWTWLAEPAKWEVTSRGIVLTEAASVGQFSVMALFVLLGAVVSLVWGWVAAWRLADLGWLLCPLVVVATVVAALIAWQIGVILGPADPAAVQGAEVGDLVPSRLRLDSVVPFLVWPILGLMGVVGATWTSRNTGGRAAS